MVQKRNNHSDLTDVCVKNIKRKRINKITKSPYKCADMVLPYAYFGSFDASSQSSYVNFLLKISKEWDKFEFFLKSLKSYCEEILSENPLFNNLLKYFYFGRSKTYIFEIQFWNKNEKRIFFEYRKKLVALLKQHVIPFFISDEDQRINSLFLKMIQNKTKRQEGERDLLDFFIEVNIFLDSGFLIKENSQYFHILEEEELFCF